jgi:hypothetical protein
MPDEILSGREAIEKAFAEVTAREPEAETVEAPEVDTSEPEAAPDGRERDELGRFKPREAAEVAEEPEAPVAPAPAPVEAPEPNDIAAQFNDPQARAAWATTPPAIKAEVNRRFSELQSGIERYRSEVEPLRRFDQQAKASGTTLAAALESYTAIEQAIARNPVEGLDLICRNLGTDIRTVAAHIAGQPAPEPNAQVAQMRQQMSAMQRELQAFRAEKASTVEKQVTDFAAEHPRFEELTQEIAWLLKTGGARDLADAYRKADLLNPIPAAAAQTSAAVSPAPQPQKPSGPVSIKGAPSSGSNPARASESLSSREAVARAFATLR